MGQVQKGLGHVPCTTLVWGKTNEKEWEIWMDNLIIEDIIQKENIPFYQYSEFQNVKLISANIFKATFKISQKTVALKNVYLNNNDKSTLNNLINGIKRHRKLEIHDSILKFYGITKQENTNNYMIILEYVNEGSLRQYLKTNFQKMDWNAKLNLANQITNVLMFLHSNDIIHGKFNSENILVHNGIIKFNVLSGITKIISDSLNSLTNTLENTNNYMIILEYVNEGSLRQYLKTNFQKMDWNAKLNLANQITNVLMFLHSNDIIHGKFNSENILVHNGIIKFNVLSGITKIISDSLNSLTNTLGPIQYMDPQYLELFSMIGKNKSSDIFGLGIVLWEISSGNPPFEMEFSSNVELLNNIAKGKREMAIPGTPHKYKEIYTDCWKHNGDSRPDIFQVVKNLSEIIISDASVEFGTSLSQPYNVTDVKLENLNMKNEPEIKPDPPFVDVTTEVYSFINNLFDIFISIRKEQYRDIQPIMIKNYIREHKKNPVKILYEMIRHPSYYLFNSLIGFFYQYGIGTVVDCQMAFEFFNLTANEIIDASSFNPSSLKKLYNINKEIGTISLADMYLDGLGVEKDTKKAFQIYNKLADKGSLIALHSVAYCYMNGVGVGKNHGKAFELYLKSAEKGNIVAQSMVGFCYKNEIGIAIDETKGFQSRVKSAREGNIDAINYVGRHYDDGMGVDKDEKEAFEWYLKAAEKGHPTAQYNLGCCYGDGIDRDEMKEFNWYKKAAENDNTDGQYMLGLCFYEGRGTKKDIVKAIYWLNKAKENGDIDANKLLKKIIAKVR
ncbi:hypothetical protein Glove_132g99 [Diversispora epigaea]|uniref:Protein kinase domain-containing protein n=1 Tax=Diversispora epigaea TaxID=1348612 RepID=A0A397IXQ7_9GLOM|nr:hypothetical protein Glove_132g99 [Diversispora epigaea]